MRESLEIKKTQVSLPFFEVDKNKNCDNRHAVFVEIRFTELDCFRVYKDKLIRNKVLSMNTEYSLVLLQIFVVVFVTYLDHL